LRLSSEGRLIQLKSEGTSPEFEACASCGRSNAGSRWPVGDRAPSPAAAGAVL